MAFRSSLIFIAWFAIATGSTALGARASGDFLTEKDARERAKWVSEVRYQMDFDLTAQGENPEFKGDVTLSFQLASVPKDLTIDLRGGQVLSAKVNAQEATLDHNGAFITVPGKLLTKGANTVTINYSHPYSNDGSGFYRFVDPEDQRVYVYTDFEPYDASRFFPSFDQPDLRAKYTLSANVPAEWHVVTSVRESSVTDISKGVKRWEFPESKEFSTYIFPLHAGPYHIWEDAAQKIPLRLMVRQSMKNYVPKDFWMTITKQGFGFFEQYFDHDYPFVKYDQVIVPDFNSGAMENVGAVTFSERYLRKGDLTRKERERMANVILHEMAHMWFGNLVTMRWWNDLWLNESFATYMASVALAEATEFKEAWLSFADSKGWAYWEDGLVTKHPITTKVPDTNQAFANFDGITYGKGASVLKQLAFFLGEDVFKKGVQDYFQKHAWGNTELPDFMGALSKAAKRDLSAFSKEWLETSGTNTVKTDFTCDAGKIATFNLVQSGEPGETQARAHRTMIALLRKTTGNKLQLDSNIAITYQGAKTAVKDAIGKDCPDMAYPNYQDFDFVKVELDARSLATTKAALRTIEDPMLRSMTWTALWDMVRDAKLTVQSYGELAKANLPAETEIGVARAVVNNIYGRGGAHSPSLAYYLPQETTAQQEQRRTVIADWENLIWKLMEGAEPGSDLQKLWFDAHVGLAETPTALERLARVIQRQYVPKGFTPDQDRRWNIINQLNTFAYGSAQKMIDDELAVDPSSSGRQAALAARAARPDLAEKEKWFAEVTKLDTSYSLAERRAIMGSLFPDGQDHLRGQFAKRYFAAVLNLAKQNNEAALESFAEELAPALCSKLSTEDFARFVKNEGKKLPSYALKTLRVAQQEDERCVKIRRHALTHKADSSAKTGNNGSSG